MTDRFPKIIALGVLAVLLSGPRTWGFPPAPHHTFYGMVRDEWGNPLEIQGAEVVFETLSGVKIRTTVIVGGQPGINYVLKVPMDSGLTADVYQPTAMRPTVPFTIKVKAGKNVYLPIEMKGNLASLGQPGRRTLLNLTLGEDSDGDGLPDAWEKALIAQMGGKKTLADINPNGDADGDGLSNMQEYLAGTYAFDPKDGFVLKITASKDNISSLEFLAIRGRSYSIQASADLHEWHSVQFRIAGAGDELRDDYLAADVRQVRVQVPAPDGDSGLKFFRLMLR